MPIERLRLTLLAAGALTTAGCAGLRAGVAGVWAVGKESGAALAWDTTLWTVGAGVGGLVLAILGYRLLARLGAFRLRGDWGRAARIATGILVPQLIALCLAGAGFFEGLYRGCSRVLTEGVATTSTYKVLGVAGAEAVGGLYFFDAEWRASGSFQQAGSAFLGRLSEFRRGEREIDAADARKRLKQLSSESLEEGLAAVRNEVRKRVPALGGGLVGASLDGLFSWLASSLSADPEASTWHLPFLPENPFIGLPDRLPEVARRTGSWSRLSYQELAEFVVEQALVRPSLSGIRVFCRGHAAITLAPIPFLILLPLAGFALARRLQGPPPDTPRSPP